MGSASSSVAYEVPAARDVDALQQLTDDLWGEQQISGKAVTRERIVGMAESRGVDRGYIESLELPAAVDGALLGSMRSGLLAVACDLDLGAAFGGDGDVGEVPESLVSGTATAAEDGAAIEGATVVVSSREGLCGSAASDAGGRFEVAVRAAGICHVDVSAAGFRPATARATLPGSASLGFALRTLHPGLYGVVVCGKTGRAIEGAVVERAGGDACLSDRDGRFYVAGRGPARVAAKGYAPALLSSEEEEEVDEDTAEARVAKLLPVTRAEVSAADGGVVADEASGSTVDIPAAAVVDEDGAAFRGTVAVAFAVIDAADADALDAMPGTLVDGDGNHIESWGACFVDLSDAQDPGKKLQIPTGAAVTLRKTVREAAAKKLQTSEAQPASYELDETTGTWTKLDDAVDLDADGRVAEEVARQSAKAKRPKPLTKNAVKKGKCGRSADFARARESVTVDAFLAAFAKDPRSTAAIGLKVRRTGFFNCDSPYKSVLVTGRLALMDDVADALAQQALVVRSVGVDYAGTVTAKAKKGSGDFAVAAQCDSQVDLEVLFMLPRDGPGGHETFKTLPIGSHATGAAGSVLDVGAVPVDRSDAYDRAADVAPDD